VAVLLGLPSSIPLLQFSVKDVAVHLAHPYDRKLSRASSVSLGFLCIFVAYQRCVGRGSPHHHGFLGRPSKWHQPLPAGGWLHTLLSFRLFFRDHSGPVCPFQCRTLERWLELLPSGDCEAHSAGKRSFASYAKRHLLQLDASSRLFGRCGLQSLHFTLSSSSWHPSDFRFHRFGRRAGPWRTSWCCSTSRRLGLRPGSLPFLSCPMRFGWES
jgi:hypothetical protein